MRTATMNRSRVVAPISAAVAIQGSEHWEPTGVRTPSKPSRSALTATSVRYSRVGGPVPRRRAEADDVMAVPCGGQEPVQME